MTAARIARGATLAVAAVVWCVCAWLLWRTSVPSLHLSGLDVHRYFSQRTLDRTASFGRGSDLLWLLGVAAELVALVVLIRVLPPRARTIGLGRIGTAVIVGMVLMVTLWFVALPFSLGELWWEHHWGLGPFDVGSWLAGQWSSLGPEAVTALVTILLLVGLAGHFRRWWLVAGPIVVVIAAIFALVSGWLAASASHPLRNPLLAADGRRLARVEHVAGTPIRVQDVSQWTDQPNAFTAGFGPSARVVLWNTLLDGRFTPGEERAVIAHELGHVRSRHILKAVGWTALVVVPVLWLLDLVTWRRGGVKDPANLPFAILALTVLSLLVTPLQNAVSRRYEAEADWRSLNATHDPVSTRQLYQAFSRTSLEDPKPPLWDYLWLETHPTVAQRIKMVEEWRTRERSP